MRWHNVEIFDVKPDKRSKKYVTVPSWWAFLEPSCVINTPYPLVLSYTTNFARVHVAHESRENVRVHSRNGLLTVSLSEFAVVSFILFIMIAREGVTGRSCDDPRLRFSATEIGSSQMPRIGTLDPSSAHPTGSLLRCRGSKWTPYITSEYFGWSPVAAPIPGASWPSCGLAKCTGRPSRATMKTSCYKTL